jgi:hypothetical protein
MDGISFAALPYVMLHEVLCHAYQMSGGSEIRVTSAVYIDPISEGMLDAIAVLLLEARAERERDSRPETQQEADSARRIHLARKSVLERSRFPQALQVDLGASVFDTVKSLYLKDGPPDTAQRDAMRLAYELNLNGWSIERRFKGLSRLRRGLAQRTIDHTLIGLLLRYRDTPKGTIQEIIGHLT